MLHRDGRHARHAWHAPRWHGLKWSVQKHPTSSIAASSWLLFHQEPRTQGGGIIGMPPKQKKTPTSQPTLCPTKGMGMATKKTQKKAMIFDVENGTWHRHEWRSSRPAWKTHWWHLKTLCRLWIWIKIRIDYMFYPLKFPGFWQFPHISIIVLNSTFESNEWILVKTYKVLCSSEWSRGFAPQKVL